MINLIPEVVRTEIVKEYWTRVITMFFFMVAITAILMAIFALPVYVLVASQADAYAESVSATEARVSQYNVSSSALLEANKMAQKVTELRNYQSFTNLVSSIEAQAGSGISVTGFNFSREEKIVSPITVVGKAKTRQDLASFRDALLNQPEVAEAILPISNLTKDRDITFTLTVKLKEDKE